MLISEKLLGILQNIRKRMVIGKTLSHGIQRLECNRLRGD